MLELGRGGGFDCFLASRQVGASGRIIGVDMTPEMVSRARENASKSGFTNTEFRLGEIEHLPVKDHSVRDGKSAHHSLAGMTNCITNCITNCVTN